MALILTFHSPSNTLVMTLGTKRARGVQLDESESESDLLPPEKKQRSNRPLKQVNQGRLVDQEEELQKTNRFLAEELDRLLRRVLELETEASRYVALVPT